MPTITKLPFNPRVISLSPERDRKRSPGLHLSTVLKDMLVTANVSRALKGRALTADEQHLLFEQGFLWERAVVDYINSSENVQIEWDRFVTNAVREQGVVDASQDTFLLRPGECEMDGVFMTPDGINTRHWHVEEWKATGIRANNFDITERRLEWLWQGASYARYYKMNRVIYRIWHYSLLPPEVTQLVVEWTDDEIEQNWSNVLSHVEFMKTRGRVSE